MFFLALNRLIYSIPTLIIISILVFLSVRMIPGDPLDFMLGEKRASVEVRKELEKKLGLDQPLYKQYFLFVGKVFKGDLGRSIVSGRRVSEEFFDRFPATVELALSSLFLALLLGLPLGILSALFHNSWWDRFVVGVSLTGYSMSVFWWGLILILFFSVHLEWTPVSGRISILYEVTHYTGFMLIDTLLSPERWPAFRSFLWHLILPTLTLATIPFVFIVRITRSCFLESLKEDFVRTAQAKGLAMNTIVWRHILKNALIPIVTVAGFMLGTLLTGAVLTETVFSWPGIGHWLVHGVLARDYSVLQGGILLIAVLVLLINLIVDLSYMKLDPRLKKSAG